MRVILIYTWFLDSDFSYGLSLDNEDSDDGTLVCKHRGTSVGQYIVFVSDLLV